MADVRKRKIISFQNFDLSEDREIINNDGFNTHNRAPKTNPYWHKPADFLPGDLNPVRDQETDIALDKFGTPNIASLPVSRPKPEIKARRWGLVATKQYSVFENHSKLEPSFLNSTLKPKPLEEDYSSMKMLELNKFDKELESDSEPNVQIIQNPKDFDLKTHKSVTLRRKRTNLIEQGRTSLHQKKSSPTTREISKKVRIAEGDLGVSYYKSSGGNEMEEHTQYYNNAKTIR